MKTGAKIKTDQVSEKEIEANTVIPSKSNAKELDGKTPFIRQEELGISKFYMGSLVSFLSTGNDTGGKSAFMIYQAKPGNEPPPHIHKWEHETYYVLEGIMEFYCDGKVMLARPGELVFLPMGKAHAFYILSPKIKAILAVQAAADHGVGLDSYFLEMSEPAKFMSLPEDEETYATVDLEQAVSVAEKHGMMTLKPEDVAKMIPHYPGFGVKRELLEE